MKNTNATIQLSDVDNQVFLVAKHWYDKQEKDKIMALRKAIAKMCWLDHVSDDDIYMLVSSVFLQYAPLSNQKEAFNWFFNLGLDKKTSVTKMEMVAWMLGAISCISIVPLEGPDYFNMQTSEVQDISNINLTSS